MSKIIEGSLVAALLVAAGCGSGDGDFDSGAHEQGTGGSTSPGGTVGTGGAVGTGGTSGTGGATGATCAPNAATDGGSAWLAPPMVPPALAVPAGAMLKLHDRGTGVQIYTCTGNASVDGGAVAFSWMLKAPDAELFDSCDRQVGTHGAGPHWTSTVDGSTVNGSKVTQSDAPDATAIPWLLLRATSTTGTGVFGDVSYIQRVNTSGGKAPATGCDATAVGTEIRVDYGADYYFYTGGAGAAWASVPPVPSVIAVPAGATLKIHDRGIGAQVYTCTASGGADGGAASYAWVLKAPDAILYDASFAQVGSHGAGPTWTSVDGSAIAGTKLQQADSPSGAIPWLLLKATSTGGSGVFDDVAFVQRLNTAGGKAPAAGCDATTVGGETRVSYSADYYFFTGDVLDGGAVDQ